MGDFRPLSVDHSVRPEGNIKSRIDSSSEERPFLQESFVKSPPESSWSDFRRKYCHSWSVCCIVLAALIPFIILRLTFFYARTIPFFFPANAPISPVATDLARVDIDAQSAAVDEASQIRPDQDAWTTHDIWYNHTSGHLVNNSKRGDDEKRYSGTHMPVTGLPEDNDDEELEDWDFYGPEPNAADDGEKSGNPSMEKGGVVGKNESRSDNGGGQVGKTQVETKGDSTTNTTVELVKNTTVDGPSKVGNDAATTLSNSTAEPTECDLFDGDWEPDPHGPLYTNATCFYIQGTQNCMKNGRQDTDYLFWKWKPRECDLPRFDAVSFLEKFKGKTVGFIGDSIARNQMQSLQCMLSQVEIPIETYQSADDQTVRWLYQGYNFTLAVVWSPYLLLESPDGFKDYKHPTLFLDVLDPAWTSVLQDFDVVVFSIGQWFLKSSIYVQQDEAIGCHYCPGLNLTEIGFQDSYKLAVREVLEKVVKEFNGIAVMSTFAISHFEGGEWDSGGKCLRRQPLSKEQGLSFPGMHNMMRDIVMEEFTSFNNHTTVKRTDNFHLDHLDVTKVGLQRADGHPGAYREFHPFEGKNPGDFVQYDCLHWCIPGPADTWNQLLVEIVKKYF